MAAALAIGLAWRRRTKWEPSEEDVSKGPQKVGGLLSGVLVVVIWSQFSDPVYLPQATRVALIMAGGCVLFLLLYGFLVATQTFQVVYSPKPNTTATRNVIGGLWLTKEAVTIKRKNKLTTQELLKGAAYDPDKLWSRFSRALAKACFVIFYLGLTVSGSVALACAAIVLDLRTRK
ncbi:MAG: hypothetical protein K6U09_01020 [Acidobacteriia bacterium]|nr:hypothetical protein [Terriglobia bacterium]